MEFRTGLGYDIHKFVEGRKLLLGGVEISYNRGLDGHSDADVVLHALCDAILGALGKGDIGEHFPNTDPRFKDIESLKLLDEVKAFMVDDGFDVVNVDAVIQAEEPPLKQYKPQMAATIAGRLGIDEARVSIKATTNETLGAIGKKEGIASFVTVLLKKD